MRIAPETLRDFANRYSSSSDRSRIAVDDKNREFRGHLLLFLSGEPHLASAELLQDLLQEEAKWSYGRDINCHAFVRLLSHLLETSSTDGLTLLLAVLHRNMDLDGTLVGGLQLSADRQQQLLATLDGEIGSSRMPAERLSFGRDIIKRASRPK